MKLVNTTCVFTNFLDSRSVAAPIPSFEGLGFKHLDLSFYHTIYKDSPWIAPGDSWKKEIEDCARYAEQYGFDFLQAHSPDGEHFAEGEARDALLTATERSIEACAMLGIPHTVVHAAQVPDGTPGDFLRENIAFYKLFEESAERFGVDLLTENSADAWNPRYYLRTGKELKEFVETAGIPRLHICWDTGHGNVQGLNQYKEVLDMGNELHALHVQDNFGNTDSHLVPMVGTCNFDRLIQGLLEIGYKGDFTFESDNPLRIRNAWPHTRRDVQEGDRLTNPPLALMRKEHALLYEIGVWMLDSYGIPVE